MSPTKLVYSFSAAYMIARGIYYYPLMEGEREQKKILYSSHILQTLMGIGMTPISIPLCLLFDISFIEKRIRHIPLSRYDSPFPYFGTYIKEEHTKGAVTDKSTK